MVDLLNTVLHSICIKVKVHPKKLRLIQVVVAYTVKRKVQYRLLVLASFITGLVHGGLKLQNWGRTASF